MAKAFCNSSPSAVIACSRRMRGIPESCGTIFPSRTWCSFFNRHEGGVFFIGSIRPIPLFCGVGVLFIDMTQNVNLHSVPSTNIS